MAKIGNINEFQPESDDWDMYIERLQMFFIANGIKDNNKVPVLITVMGQKAYKKLRTLCSPATPDTKSFNELVSIMREGGNNPKPSQTAARYVYRRRYQKPDETIAEFHLALKELAEDCEFRCLEEELRDQLVSGLRDERLKAELFRDRKLTYKTALQKALSNECAHKDTLATQTDAHDVESGSAVSRLSLSRRKDYPKCKHCGKNNHKSHDCYFKNSKCNTCQTQGHIAPACPRKSKLQPKKSHGYKNKRVHQLQESETSDSESDVELPIKTLALACVNRSSLSDSHPPIILTMKINGKPMEMELDTGATVSVINETDYNQLDISSKLQPTDIRLRAYGDEIITPIGKVSVEVSHTNDKAELVDLYVVQGHHQALIGRPWLRSVKLDWEIIRNKMCPKPMNQLNEFSVENNFPDLFSEGLGKMKGVQAKIDMKINSQPKFFKARAVPIAIKEKVNAEIARLEKEEILSPVRHSEWATPIVPIIKPDGSVRICGDIKITVNPQLNIERYPQPRREDLFSELAHGESFSKVDLAQAYLQMEVEEGSRKYLTINTPRGLYQYNRLVFGIASAPAIFQRAIESILSDIPNVLVYQDDILVTGKNRDEHKASLSEVLERLQNHNLRVKLSKCKFFAPSITYLGHKIDTNGVSTIENKVQGIKDAPAPKNVSDLRSFLGTVNYYGHFIHNLSTKLKPLNNLLKSETKWQWTPECEKTFLEVKQILQSAPILAHYDPKLPVTVACDASPVGIAAVLSHRYSDGSERPVAYASRTLTKAEMKYAQIDREALAIIFGVKKFNEYLFGRSFILITDNRPLTHIFAPSKMLPTVANARIQRWAIYLGAHNYTIEHRSAKDHTNVDGLSRLPAETEDDEEDPVKILHVSQMETIPVTSRNIAQETIKDPILKKVLNYTMNGWDEISEEDKNELEPYFHRRNEISVYKGVLMWGIRIIIPQKYRNEILNELHAGHLGIVKMKSISRSYVYWPNIDKQLEQKANSCSGCAQVRKLPPTAPLHPWEWPTKPWVRLHIDFAGPYLNQMFLIIVDAHSKWPEVIPMKHASSAGVIEALRSLFARYGIPEQIVSDNGSQFTSNEFSTFLMQNGVRHIAIAQYHPATNGLAERFVQTFKNAMKCNKATERNIERPLQTFLLAYRNSAHSTTGNSPAELLYGRNLKTRLDLLKPSAATTVLNKQTNQTLERAGKERHLEVGDSVLARDFRPNQPKWMSATVEKALGTRTFEVKTEQKQLWKRHIDHIIKSQTAESESQLEPECESKGNRNEKKEKRTIKKPTRLIAE